VVEVVAVALARVEGDDFFSSLRIGVVVVVVVELAAVVDAALVVSSLPLRIDGCALTGDGGDNTLVR
jgi:hypothetical protein